MKNYILQGIILRAADKLFLFTYKNVLIIYRFFTKLYFHKSKRTIIL